MKNQFLPLTLIMLFFTTSITSCKKSKEGDTIVPQQETCYISAVTNPATGDTTSIFMYDNQNRLKRTQELDDAGVAIEYSVYEYLPGKLIITDFNQDMSIDTKTEYYLNANGTVEYDASMYVILGGDTVQSDTTFYTYNNEGYVVLEVRKLVTEGNVSNTRLDSTIFTYTNGNLTHEKIVSHNGTNITEVTNVYSTLEDNQNNLDQVVGVKGLFGKRSRNFIASSSSILDGVEYKNDTHIYELNDKGLVTRRLSIYEYNSNPVITKDSFNIGLRYNCK